MMLFSCTCMLLHSTKNVLPQTKRANAYDSKTTICLSCGGTEAYTWVGFVVAGITFPGAQQYKLTFGRKRSRRVAIGKKLTF